MSLSKKAFSGFFWSYAQQFSGQLINFVITLVLARLLMPEDFGLIGLVYVFIGIGNSLVDSGLSNSLIRTKNATSIDYSTVFFSNLVFSIFVYISVYIAAPYIADYYNKQTLVSIIRVFSLTFIITAFSSVQNAVLIKEMKFKSQMLINVPSILVSGIAGIILAYFGFGVWSLVWAALIKATLASMQLWYYQNWKPKFIFDKEKFLFHFNFGYKLSLTGILNTIFVNIYPIIIGKVYSISQVGLYTQAETLKQLPISNITGAISNVTFPLFSEIQNNIAKLKEVYNKITMIVLLVLSPLLLYMAALSRPVLELLYSKKWLEAAPFLEILCYASILPIINNYNINILKVKGKSSFLLRMEIFNKISLVALIFAFYTFGIYGLIWSKVVSSIISFFINSYYCGKEINFTLQEQMLKYIPIMVFAAISAILVHYTYIYLDVILKSLLLKLTLSTLVGLVLYTIVVYFVYKDFYKEVKLLLATNINKR